MKKSTRIKTKLFIVGLLLAVALLAVLAINYSDNTVAYANNESKSIEEFTLDEIKEMLSVDGHQYKRVYSETGNVETFEIPIEDEFINYFSADLYSRGESRRERTDLTSRSNPFPVTTIVSSGLPDNQSVVIVFMGDGFTAGTGANQIGN